MDQFRFYSQNYKYLPVPHNRVHINPNFNRNATQASIGPNYSSANVMYVNPNFAHGSQYNYVQPAEQILKPKIHVNPNFIKPQDHPVTYNQQQASNSVPNVPNSLNANEHTTCIPKSQVVNEHQNLQTAAAISNSKYSLVRKTANKDQKTPLKSVTKTVKVNKYKLVSLNAMKKNIACDKSKFNKTSETVLHENNQIRSKSKYRITSKPASNNIHNTRTIKRNSISNSVEMKVNTVRRSSLTPNKNILKPNSRQTKKIIKGAMKKNNIPCPIYKKCGKCLRFNRGICDYLHDKKHVSICRKFLKGYCHDEQCLLSHDLTDKKMPTCHFYLQGMCTNEDCPYLHVKLSESTKICPDFVKGYCEKGDQCLYRHIASEPVIAGQRELHSHQKTKTYIDKPKTSRKSKVYKKCNGNPVPTVSPETCNETSEHSGKDNRYFKDANGDTCSDEQYNVKPMRCKLGTLPSFIQF